MQNPSDFSALIETRKPVWIALSELFLDTDPSLAYAYIARTLAASPYTLNELYAILCYEVAPLLKINLYAPAGVWEGFDEDWLVKKLTPGINRKPWFSFGLPKAIQADWQETKRYIEIYRQKN